MATQPKPQPEPKPPEPKPEDEEATVVMTPPQYREGGSRAPTSTASTPNHQLTFGEKAVGLNFNPSGDPSVNELKQLYAQIIDICHARRGSLMQGSEAHRLYAIAITEAQGAQMWAVKAATWKD